MMAFDKMFLLLQISKGISTVASIPAGYHSITPCLVLCNASDAIEFYKKAFNAEEVLRFNSPDGRIGYAELNIGDSKIMLNNDIINFYDVE